MPTELITYDSAKCIRCGLCAKACPRQVLKQEAQDRIPEVVLPEVCIFCGHCVSVCTKDAITHNRVDMGGFRPIDSSPITPATMEPFLLSKRSVRFFLNKPLPRATLDKLLEIAGKSASSSNSQRRSFVVVTDADKIKKIESDILRSFSEWLKVLETKMANDGSGTIPEVVTAVKETKYMIQRYTRGTRVVFRNAPCVVFIHGPKIAGNIAAMDCITAQSYLMLQAHSMGIGSCVAGLALHTPDLLNKHLDLPENRVVFCAILLGYPAFKYRKIVPRPQADVKWM
ncbi:MAG: nitroreductase family protein [Kiritimatiellae bacterium]|nr:nitroreductase family protein [Kiritimatiellia bacterium]MDD5519740.1 nitroreductase family protein [Kiritimatiellia bacterium]